MSVTSPAPGYDVFGFGMQLDAYLRDTPWDLEESYTDRLKRTLAEVTPTFTGLAPAAS